MGEWPSSEEEWNKLMFQQLHLRWRQTIRYRDKVTALLKKLDKVNIFSNFLDCNLLGKCWRVPLNLVSGGASHTVLVEIRFFEERSLVVFKCLAEVELAKWASSNDEREIYNHQVWSLEV